MDHTFYQAGLSLNVTPSSEDRLGLRHAIKDKNVDTLKVEDVVTEEFVLKLRGLVKQYGTKPLR
jgi:hypothetical protein